MTEFAHGGGVEAFAKSLNCEVGEVIDLSSNINFVKPTINLNFNDLEISSYPTYDKLYDAISINYGVKNSEIELFNGGSSGIFTLFRHLGLDTCTIYSPAYLEYKKAAKKFGYKLDLVNRFENIDRYVEKKSLVVFVNPSTPDGKKYNIDEFFKHWVERECTIFIDESFLDFCEGDSAIKFLKEYDKLYILKSMTKFYSSAGIRVGTIISNEKNISKLREFEPMWKLSQFDSHYLQHALKDMGFKLISNAINVKSKLFLEKTVNSSSLFEKVFESNANFLLVKLKDMNAVQFQELLKPYKIMVRDCSNFDYLDERYVRIAVKSEKQLSVFAKALKDIDANKK